jgi:hypothetical protein
MWGRGSFGDRYRARARRAGLLWNRLVGTLLVVVGGYVLLLTFASATFSLATRWPAFVAVAGLWWLARWFFSSAEAAVRPEGHAPSGAKAYPLEGLDRGIGTVLARLAGTIAVLGGAAAAASSLTLEGFTLAEYWPVLAMAAILLLVGRACFAGRPSFLDMMSETPLSPGEAARRRDMAVDDEGRG